ncbi:MAG: DUF3853 family protein [Bacteroidaceae bacterium]|nr:DUF3853 family protein [Bacteroidaceae bacterium]
MKVAVLFVRVSTDKQRLESQIEALKRAALVDGYHENQFVIIGKKESAVKLDEAEREGLNELKECIAANDVDCVYVFELSRLSRRPMVLYSLRDLFLAEKIQLKCLSPQFTLLTEDRSRFDSMSSLVFSIFGTYGEQEAVEKKERFHRGKMQLANEGKFAGGRVPYGYMVDYAKNKLIVVNDEEADVIRLIFNLYDAGVSVPKITAELRERGIRYSTFSGNVRGKERDFDVHFIHQLLTNELLTGRPFKGPNSSFERRYPPIISEEQFDRCRIIAADKNTRPDTSRRIYYAHRLITCQECGYKFSGSGLKIGYRCYNAGMPQTQRKYNYMSTKPECNNRLNISVNVMDSLAWHVAQLAECEYIVNAAEKDKNDYESKVADLKQKMVTISKKLDELGEKRDRIVSLYLDGDIDEKRKTAEFAKLEVERNDLNKQKITAHNDISHFEELISGLSKIYNFDLESVESTYSNLDKILAIRDALANIDSDFERYKLCQKHIQEILIDKATIQYKFKTERIGTKQAFARFIRLILYSGETHYFYFLPFDGHNGHFINSNKDGDVLDNAEIPILRRYVDTSKVKQREKRAAKIKEKYDSMYSPDKHYIKGVCAMASYFSVANATMSRWISTGFFNEAISQFDKKTKILDVEKALELMRKSDNVWIKKILDHMNDKNLGQ